MTEDAIKRRLAAIFSAGATNYSHPMHDDEMATIETITAYREMISMLVLQYHGRVVDSPGDNILAEFASVIDAVQAATTEGAENPKWETSQKPQNAISYRHRSRRDHC